MPIKAYLAPMCGVTDYTYREVCRKHANVITTTEMVSAKALEQRNNPPKYSKGDGVQLVGHEPDILVKALEHFPNAGFIELNAGCPVHKVVKKQQGSALLKNPELLRECAKALVNATSIPVTVKTRLGWGKERVSEIAKTLNGIGLNRVVMHARLAKQDYGDEPDWKALKKAVEELDCPVTGNGNVVSYQTAKKMIEETGCEGVMVGRAAIHNPFVFSAIEDKKDYEPTREERADFFDEYAANADVGFFDIRAHGVWLCHGFRYATRIRTEMVHAEDVESVRSLLRG